MIDSVVEGPKRILQTKIPGTGKDGGPSCATIKPMDGWMESLMNKRLGYLCFTERIKSEIQMYLAEYCEPS